MSIQIGGQQISLSRIVNALGYISALVVSLQLGGALNLMSPKVAAVVLAVGASASALSERLQGSPKQ